MIVVLLLFALQPAALDRAVEHLEGERFEEALAELEGADRDDPRYEGTRDGAIRGVARDRQRADGYRAAIEFLEPRLESRAILDHYVETCIWAGEETRALALLRSLRETRRFEALYAEYQLRWARREFGIMEELARELEWPEGVAFAQEQAALRNRFDHRASRAWWTALVAFSAFGAAYLALRRRAARA